MKIASYNVKGLHDSGKAKALWTWIFSGQLDVCCIQEHKFHEQAGLILHYRGYTLFYGGTPGSYSGTLTCIKDIYNPTIHMNHSSGRCLGITAHTPSGTIHIYNVYAHNAHMDRTLLWEDLTLQPPFEGLLCGDFNVVLDEDDSTTRAAHMTWAEKSSWESLVQMHNLQDAWPLLHSTTAFTFHSQAHIKAWARLDRFYLSGTNWCPPHITLMVDYKLHLSDHFPIIIDLQEYNWKLHMQGCSVRRPLMVNNLHCGKSLFRDYVTQVCLAINDTTCTALEKWQTFIIQMQRIIKITGKWYAFKNRAERDKCATVLQSLREKANVCPLTLDEEHRMSHAVSILHQADMDASRKARFLSRCHALQDKDCISKGFFDRLRGNRNRTTVATLTLDDGTCIHNAVQIAQTCTEYFGKILSTASTSTDLKQSAMRAILGYVDTSISVANANRMEGSFTKEELFYALSHLQNEKTPGLDGLSKEFMIQFWEILQDWVVDIINQAWTSQNLHPTLAKGIIKLLPKQTFCSTLAHWRPITMMGIVYKIMTKAIAIRIHPLLRQSVHSSQSGFIGGRSIYDNILAVQLGIECAQRSHQETVLLQLDFAKAFDSVDWGFISQTLSKMGFGPRISNTMFMLGQGSQSVISINGHLTDPINICRSVRQGCPLSPLLFAVATHPLFCMLERLSLDGILHGLRVQNRHLAGLGFADDTLMFLKASNDNLATCITLLGLFSDASDLRLNIDKSTLIDVSASSFADLLWPGKRVHRGQVFRYLGYPLGVQVTNKQLIDWVLNKIRKKIQYWHASEWPLHVRIRITQAILVPYVLYYLPLLDWKKSHLDSINTLLMRFVWNAKTGKPVFPHVNWTFICTPKLQGGVGLLNLEAHMQARRATFIHHMLDNKLIWVACMWELIHLGTVYFHGKWTLSAWDKLFSHAPLKVYTITASMLVKSWKMSCARLIWKGRIRYTGNSIRSKNVHWSFLFQTPPALHLGHQSRYLANKGIMHISHVMDSEGTFLCFFVVRRRHGIGMQYRRPWHLICTFVHRLPIPMVDNGEDRFRDWALPQSTTDWWKAGTSTFYYMFVPTIDWSERGYQTWHVTHDNKWWIQTLNKLWHSPLCLQARIFLWRVFVGGLPLAAKLRQRGFTDGLCPRCLKSQETARHTFWYCPLVLEWWRQLCSVVYHSTGLKLTRHKFTFHSTVYPAYEHEWLITHVHYWFLQVIWLTRNAALHSGHILYGAGLPTKRLQTYLLEALLVDSGMAGSFHLPRFIHSLGGT